MTSPPPWAICWNAGEKDESGKIGPGLARRKEEGLAWFWGNADPPLSGLRPVESRLAARAVFDSIRKQAPGME